MEIVEYSKAYQQEIINLILDIQQNEFDVPVTIADQPDLLDIENFYCKGLGNFWLAMEHGAVIGSVALIDIGNRQSALRKMFVHKAFRGKDRKTGQQLLDQVIHWCLQHGMGEIYLGTFDKLVAAQRFYLKNGFTEVQKQNLPARFPLMAVDNMFFKLILQ